MLDMEAGGEPFFKVERPGEPLQGRFDPSSEVTDEIWTARYVPRLEKVFQKGDSVEVLRREIQTVIKGSPEALRNSKGRLSEGEYVSGCRESSVPEESARERYYAGFLVYESLKKEFCHFDASDVVRDLERRLSQVTRPMHNLAAVFIDEAQDLLPCELRLLRRICADPQGFVFAGDTAQTILKAVDFRFETVRALLHRLPKQQPCCLWPRRS